MKYSEKNKPLVCMQTNSDCYKGTTTIKPVGVLWHSTGANNKTIKRYVQPIDASETKEHPDNTYTNAKLMEILGDNKYNNDWNHIERRAGLNAWIGVTEDGTVTSVQTMPWNYKPWGCGAGAKGSCNDGWLQFEICEDDLADKAYFEAAYTEACELTAYLCKMFNLDPKGTVDYKGVTVPVILCHADSYKLGLGNNHGDILHWFKKYGVTMDDIRDRVAKLLEEPKQQPVYRIRKTWEDSKSQKGAFTNLASAQKCCDEAGPEYEVYNEDGVAIYPERNEVVEETKPVENARPFELGAEVKIAEGAVWNNGKAVPSWVIKSKLYVRGYKSDTIVTVSTLRTGAVTGSLDVKYVSKYEKAVAAAPSFKPYIVRITASALNVRAGAGTKYKVNTVVKKNELYTIVDEKDGWGKLKSGAGWISLNYTAKVK